ncbi:AfsR/SARP family transcriptional regulator [Nocardia thraciensis]
MIVLIALTGLGSQTGVTTTAVALAAAWPGPEPAVVVEANPAGGRLAEVTGADPGLGLASLAASAAHGTPDSPATVRVLDHVQVLPSGVLYLAAPSSPQDVCATLSAPMTVTDTSEAGLSDLVVFADCGKTNPDSPASPLTAGPDVLVVVVRADLADPELASRRISEITEHADTHAVILIGGHPGFADHLGVPILGQLPVDRRAATAVLHSRPRPRFDRNPVRSAARDIAEDMYVQLAEVLAECVPPLPRPSGRRRPWWRGRTAGCTRAQDPAVYRLSVPTTHRDTTDAVADTTGTVPVAADREALAQSDPPGSECCPPPAPVDPPPLQLPYAADDTDTAPETSLREAHAAPASGHVGPDPVAESARPPRPLHGTVTGDPGARAGMLVIEMFGPLRVTWRPPQRGDEPGPDEPGHEGVDITGLLRERSRDLLMALAAHPDGMTRQTLVETLWSDQNLRDPANTIRTVRGRLRADLAAATDGGLTDILATDRLRYRLDPARVTVDYWSFTAAVSARWAATTDADRLAARRDIADTTRGRVLAADLHATWIEEIREAARRDTVNAHIALGHHYADNDPRRALELLENVARHNPHDEQLWQAILRLHTRLGEPAAAERTLTLLTRRLAEIGAEPEQNTREPYPRTRRQQQ